MPLPEWDPPAPPLGLEGDSDSHDNEENRWTNVHGMTSLQFERLWELSKRAVTIMPRPVEDTYSFVRANVWSHWKANTSWDDILDDVEADLTTRGLLTQPA